MPKQYREKGHKENRDVTENEKKLEKVDREDKLQIGGRAWDKSNRGRFRRR